MRWRRLSAASAPRRGSGTLQGQRVAYIRTSCTRWHARSAETQFGARWLNGLRHHSGRRWRLGILADRGRRLLQRAFEFGTEGICACQPNADEQPGEDVNRSQFAHRRPSVEVNPLADDLGAPPNPSWDDRALRPKRGRLVEPAPRMATSCFWLRVIKAALGPILVTGVAAG